MEPSSNKLSHMARALPIILTVLRSSPNTEHCIFLGLLTGLPVVHSSRNCSFSHYTHRPCIKPSFLWNPRNRTPSMFCPEVYQHSTWPSTFTKNADIGWFFVSIPNLVITLSDFYVEEFIPILTGPCPSQHQQKSPPFHFNHCLRRSHPEPCYHPELLQFECHILSTTSQDTSFLIAFVLSNYSSVYEELKSHAPFPQFLSFPT